MEPSAEEVASQYNVNLLSITALCTPVIPAVLIAALSPAMSLLGLTGTATEVPLITKVFPAVKSFVTAFAPVIVG